MKGIYERTPCCYGPRPGAPLGRRKHKNRATADGKSVNQSDAESTIGAMLERESKYKLDVYVGEIPVCAECNSVLRHDGTCRQGHQQ